MDSAHVGAPLQSHPSTDGARLKLTIPTLTTSALRSTLTSSSLTSIDSYHTALSYSCSITTSFGTYHTAYPPWYSGTPSMAHSPDTNGFELNEDDIIIAVMGPTGAGKSTFIKIATGSEDVQIGDSLRSCTQHVQAIRCHSPLRGQRVVFVDVPGFNDDTRSDTEILAEVAQWLEKTYKAGVKLSGILYLHRITDNRIMNTLIRNLDMFQKLCGNNALSNVRLVTTHWDRLKDGNEGITNEGELRKKYWNTFLPEGPQMLRFEYTCSSAWGIIDSLMGRKAIQIQKEMVDQRKSLWETSAARSLLSWVHRAVEAPKNHIRVLQESMEKRGKEKKKRKEKLTRAQKLLKKPEDDKSQSYNRTSIINSNHSSSRPPSLNSTASTWRYIAHKISARSERRLSQRRHAPIPSVCSKPESTVAKDVFSNPPGASSTLKSLSYTIQRLQAVRATAAAGVIPGFEGVVEIILRISKALNETPDAHYPLSSLMDSTSWLLCAINDKYLPTRRFPSSVVESFENIYRQLVHIQDIVMQLKDCKVEPQMSSSLSPDDQRAIAKCREAVISASRKLKAVDLTSGKTITTAPLTTQTPTEHSVTPNTENTTGTNYRGSEDLPHLPRSAEILPKIIAVMGSTGSGKSTLIKAATRTDDGRLPSLMDNVVLVDTPGLDDAFEGDVQILKGIEKWLKDTYPSGARLSGILFLQNIMDQRVTTNTMLLNFDLFQNLCNSALLPSTILVTTNWDQLDTKNACEGDAHEQQLRNKYWRPLLNNGSKMLRFENTCFSAWNIVKSFPNNAEVKGDGKKKSI